MPTSELIERLEKATGPSEELDAAIMKAIGWRDDGEHMGQPRWVTPQGVKTAFHPRKDGPVHRYTVNVHEALALLPEDYDWELSKEHTVWGGIIYRCEAGPSPLVKAPTPALAVCIAALRARKDRKDEGVG
jgi:hypothetical protein